MNRFKWFLAGLLLAVGIPLAYGLTVNGELKGALLELLSSEPSVGVTKGRIYMDTVTNKPRIYNGSAWGDLGSGGAGEINYNDDADGTGNWTDIGAGLTVTTTTTEAEIPRWPLKTQAVLLTNDGSGTSGWSVCVEVGEADRTKKLKIEWAQIVSGYASGDFEYQFVSETNDTCTGTEGDVNLHSRDPNDFDPVAIPNQTGTMYDEFDGEGAQYYELKFVRAAGASGTIGINDLVIGPGKLHSGAVVTAWESYTTTPTGFALNSQSLYYRRVGDSLEIFGSMNVASVSGNSSFSIPSGLTTNTTIAPLFTEAGRATLRDVGSSNYQVSLWVDTTTTIGIAGNTYDGTAITTSNDYMDTDSPFTWASNDFIRGVSVKVPITEWAGSGVLSVITQDNLSEWTDFTPVWTNLTVGNATQQWRKKKVGDSLYIAGTILLGSTSVVGTLPTMKVPVADGSSSYYTVASGITANSRMGFGYLFDASASTNSQIARILVSGGQNTFRVFGDPSTVNATYPFTWATGDIIEFDLQVQVTEFAGSQSSLVGYTHATEDYQGLVKRNKWQIKYLSGDATTSGGLDTGLGFTTEVGKLYRVTLSALVDQDASDVYTHIDVNENSNRVLNVGFNSGAENDRKSDSVIFKATGNSVTYTINSLSGTTTIRGNSQITETWAMIEELDNYGEETDEF